MTIEASIETALKAHTALLNVTGDPPLAWPNDVFPPEGQNKPARYIEVRHFPNSNTRRALKGTAAHIRQGILQLTIYSPLLEGSDQTTALGGEIAEHFPADLALFEGGIKVRIQKAPDLGVAEKTDDGVSWSAAVSVSYEALA